MKAELQNIVTTEENMHFQLSDGLSQEWEVHPNINLNLKIKVKDRTLPLVLTFYYADEKRKDLTLYYSPEIREPNEQMNHGVQVNVSIFLSNFCSQLNSLFPLHFKIAR